MKKGIVRAPVGNKQNSYLSVVNTIPAVNTSDVPVASTSGRRPTDLGRMPQMDGLRTLAVSGVMCAHWWNPYPLGFPAGSGVLLFFVISGFLITGILIDCWAAEDGAGGRLHAIRNFYARRFLRIFPLYYATLAGAALLNIEPVRQTILWHLSYLTNFYLFNYNNWHGRISHFWSLAVEEQFYLLWPTVVLFMNRRFLARTIVSLIVFSLVFRVAMTLAFPSRILVAILTPSCFDALGIGALLAYTIRQVDGMAKAARLARWLLILGLPVFVITWFCHQHDICAAVMGAVYQTFLVMCFGWLVFNAARGFGGIGQMLGWKPVVYLGQISYGLYVFHYFAPWFVYWILARLRFSEAQINALVNNRWLDLGVMIAVTVGGAMLSWHLFEKPINNLKSYFPYKSWLRVPKTSS
jgi:peptidoglycan/LPS O-acetylase OafA/YrhL